jgi:putative ABC transport system permease protein
MMHRISDDGTPDIYIPIQVFTALNPGTGITYAEAATDDTTTVGENGDRLDEALAAAGKNPYEYTVVDYNLKRELMEQKPSIIIFIMGMLIIFTIGRYAFRNVRSIVDVVRHGIRDDYLINVLKKNRFMLLKYILGVIFPVLSIILLWQLIKFEMYIPKKYIPEELTNLGFYFNLAKEGIQEGINSLGYIPSPQEFMVGRADAVLTWSMYLGIIAGFLLFYTGMVQLKLSFKGIVEEGLLNAGIMVLLCLITVRITAAAAGLPFTLRFADGVVWCIFIFLNASMLDYKVWGRTR